MDNWKYVKPLQDVSALRYYLREHNIILPQYLVEIMEKYNGGRPEDKHIITSSNRESVFKSLISYNKEDKETIYSVYPECYMESSLYPIASDSAGNFICFDLKTQLIVLNDHESNNSEEIIKCPALKI